MKVMPIGEIERLREFVAASLGLHFGHDSVDHLAAVFADRLRCTGCADAAAYWQRLRSAGAAAHELRQLATALTVAETYFFRHPEQYQALATIALRQRLADRGRRRPVRILSAGCASGEEAYSLAATVRTTLGPIQAREVEVIGIDINPVLLEKARRGRYSAWSLRATSQEQRECCFRAEGKEFVLEDALRAAVKFEERNLIEDDHGFWAPDRFDIVFCRNVMIYFASATIRDVIAKIARSMVHGGFLFLGPSETLRGVSQDFHLRHTHGAFYYQRRDSDRGQPGASSYPIHSAWDDSHHPQATRDHQRDDSWFGLIGEASERIAALAQRSQGNPPGGSASRRVPAKASPNVTRQQWDLSAAKELLRQERFADVIDTLQALGPESEVDPDVLLLRAVVLTNGGKLAEAEEICLRVLQLDDLNAGAHYLRALCREHAGDRASAIEHDQTAIYLDPSFAMPRLHLGLMAQRSGEHEAAQQQLRDALVLLSQEDAARILLFGGGFHRESLMQLCRSALNACGGSM